jgi:translation initiation factor 6 (eIF-6)
MNTGKIKMKQDKETEESKVAKEIGEDIVKTLNQFYKVDSLERSVIATKLFPIFMKLWNKGIQSGKQIAKNEILDIIKKEVQKARMTTFYKGIGNWTESSDVSDIQDSLNIFEQNLIEEINKGDKRE